MKSKISFLILTTIIGLAFAQNMHDFKNLKGYVVIKQKGVVKNYIIIANENAVKLVPINKDPSVIIKDKHSIFKEIDKGGKQ